MKREKDPYNPPWGLTATGNLPYLETFTYHKWGQDTTGTTWIKDGILLSKPQFMAQPPLTMNCHHQQTIATNVTSAKVAKMCCSYDISSLPVNLILKLLDNEC